MPGKDIRRHDRRTFTGRVRLSWDDGHGNSKYAHGKCLDFSETGLRIEAPAPIPVSTNVSLSAEAIKLTAGATVKHLVRRGHQYVIGLEFTQALHEKTMAAIRQA